MKDIVSSINWKKLQESLVDSAKMSSNEFKRGLEEAKNQIEKFHLVKKRKNLLAELGRSLYELSEDNLPKDMIEFMETTELKEIINEIREVDNSIIEVGREEK